MTARLAIDIGVRELKIVQADGRHLTGHAEILLPDGAVQDGVPTPLLTAAIRSSMEAAGIGARLARIAIADTGIAVRDFTLPRLPAQELADAVIFEGRRLLPLDANSVYYAWHAQPTRTGHAIYLVAARRDMIDAIVAAVSEAGLRIERIDVKPLALARGAGVSDGLVLEWGASEATLVLMVSGRARFFRTFLLDAPSENVDAQLDELAFSLKALVRFMRTAAPDAPVGPTTSLYLVGRLAFIEEGLQRAQQRFDFVVRPSAPSGFKPSADFPWQAHLAGLGLLQPVSWRRRLDPSQRGDVRVAA
ncbi:MAG TPA: hypothetical protein VIO62_09490 [Candidatus Dormibacteraeota bacterium]